MKKIAVVGGGTAGFVAALILKTKFDDVEISVIRSDKIGIIGVGEGSTEHWTEFINYVGIEISELIKETDASFKAGIKFQNWGNPEFYQSIGEIFNFTHLGYPAVFAKIIADGKPPNSTVSPLSLQDRANIWFLSQDYSCQVTQFHFNTFKLNDYLTRKSIQRGISVIDDEILDVVFNDSGEIDHLIGSNFNHDYDFYIDCTGFSKFLIKKLGAKWKSYSEFLSMNSAIVFPLENHDEIPMWTLARAMDAGWMFRIPVWGRYGNGYIFDRNYIDEDAAKQEIERYLEREVEIKKRIDFDPGALDRTWIKNCCAVGLSASFIEPLEASSIGTSIQQSFLLAENLINYNEKVIEKYNREVNDILNNIRDFVALHYITGRSDTKFWQDQSHKKIPDDLSDLLTVWKHKIPCRSDFSHLTDKILFSELHFTMILHGLNLFDIDSIKREYHLNLNQNKKQEVEKLLYDFKQSKYQTVSHKTMLQIYKDRSIIFNDHDA